MIPLSEQIKTIQTSIKGLEHELQNESIFPPVKKELIRRKQSLEDTILTLAHLAPLLEAYAVIDHRANP